MQARDQKVQYGELEWDYLGIEEVPESHYPEKVRGLRLKLHQKAMREIGHY